MEKIEKIKILREETSMSISECNKALLESQNDLELAKKILLKKMDEIGNTKLDKKTKYGVFGIYNHFAKSLLCIIELHSETDFVSKTIEFKNLANDLAIQLLFSLDVKYISEDNIPENEKFYYNEDKLNNIILLRQPFYKDSNLSIKNLLNQASAKFGEKIEIKAFYRLSLI